MNKKLEYKRIQVKVIPDNVDTDLIIRLMEPVRFKVTPITSALTEPCYLRGEDSSVITHIKFNGKIQPAHRASYQIFSGRTIIMSACHKCGNVSCINNTHVYDGKPLSPRSRRIAKGLPVYTKSGDNENEA